MEASWSKGDKNLGLLKYLDISTAPFVTEHLTNVIGYDNIQIVIWKGAKKFGMED